MNLLPGGQHRRGCVLRHRYPASREPGMGLQASTAALSGPRISLRPRALVCVPRPGSLWDQGSRVSWGCPWRPIQSQEISKDGSTQRQQIASRYTDPRGAAESSVEDPLPLQPRLPPTPGPWVPNLKPLCRQIDGDGLQPLWRGVTAQSRSPLVPAPDLPPTRGWYCPRTACQAAVQI